MRAPSAGHSVDGWHSQVYSARVTPHPPVTASGEINTVVVPRQVGFARPSGEATVSGAPARGWRHELPYLITCVPVLLYAGLAAVKQPFMADFGVHAGTVEQLRRSLLHPADPMVDVHSGSPYFTPYTVVLGAIAKLTGWSGITTMSAAAPVCAALFLYGLYRFVRTFTDRSWAPVVALPLVVLMWGTQPLVWSGFLNFRGLPQILPYPSTFAIGLTLLWWALLTAAIDHPRLWRWLVVGALFGIIVLVHPFTTVSAAIGALAIGLCRLKSLRLHLVLVAVAVAVAVALVWPYYSVITELRSSGDLNPIHRMLYDNIAGTYVLPLLLCVPALVVRLRRNRRDPLVWAFGMSALLVAAGGVTGNWAIGRVWPLVMITAQVALAIEVVDAVAILARRAPTGEAPRARRGVRAWGGAWVAVVVVFASLSLYHQIRLAHAAWPATQTIAFSHREGWIADQVPAGDIVLYNPDVSYERWTARDLLGHGVHFVASPWPNPVVKDEPVREDAVRVLLAADTPVSRRQDLLRQYHVRWILDTRGDLTWADSYAVEIVHGPGVERLLRLN